MRLLLFFYYHQIDVLLLDKTDIVDIKKTLITFDEKILKLMII
jgi:hypothetical protein